MGPNLTGFWTAKETIDKMKRRYYMGKYICKWYDWQGVNVQHV